MHMLQCQPVGACSTDILIMLLRNYDMFCDMLGPDWPLIS